MNEAEKIDNQQGDDDLSIPKRYFHELEQSEINNLIADKKTIGYIIKNYRQPDWCKYPNALAGELGCWSLTDLSKDGLRSKISKDFCKDCDCFSSVERADREQIIQGIKSRIESEYRKHEDLDWMEIAARKIYVSYVFNPKNDDKRNIKKVFKTAHIRDLERRVALGKITYSRMVEILNEMAYKEYANVE